MKTALTIGLFFLLDLAMALNPLDSVDQLQLQTNQQLSKIHTPLERQNLNIVREIHQNFKKRNIQGILDQLDEDVLWKVVGPPSIAFTGVRNGIGEVGEFFNTLDRVLNIYTFTDSEYFVDGDTVTALGSLQSQIRENGLLGGTDWVHVFTLKKGKVTRMIGFFDSGTLLEGLMEIPPASQNTQQLPLQQK